MKRRIAVPGYDGDSPAIRVVPVVTSFRATIGNRSFTFYVARIPNEDSRGGVSVTEAVSRLKFPGWLSRDAKARLTTKRAVAEARALIAGVVAEHGAKHVVKVIRKQQRLARLSQFKRAEARR